MIYCTSTYRISDSLELSTLEGEGSIPEWVGSWVQYSPPYVRTFLRDENMALWGSASVISMGDSPKVPFFQDVLEFGTRRQLELFTIIGKIAIIQDVLEFGTSTFGTSTVQLYMFAIVQHA